MTIFWKNTYVREEKWTPDSVHGCTYVAGAQNVDTFVDTAYLHARYTIGFLAVLFTYVGVDFLLPQIHGTQS